MTSVSITGKTSAHVQCRDCGKCRMTQQAEEWCGDCEYWSCERGDDCGDEVTRKRKRYMVKDTRLTFLTPAERRDMECPTPPELEETCVYLAIGAGEREAHIRGEAPKELF